MARRFPVGWLAGWLARLVWGGLQIAVEESTDFPLLVNVFLQIEAVVNTLLTYPKYLYQVKVLY